MRKLEPMGLVLMPPCVKLQAQLVPLTALCFYLKSSIGHQRLNPAANDYTDTITVIGAGNFKSP